jgi:hypothetical protein
MVVIDGGGGEERCIATYIAGLGGRGQASSAKLPLAGVYTDSSSLWFLLRVKLTLVRMAHTHTQIPTGGRRGKRWRRRRRRSWWLWLVDGVWQG